MVICACHLDQPNEDFGTTPEELIIDHWEWRYDVYYYTMSGVPYFIAPDSVGYTHQREFRSDGQVKFYRNDTLQNVFSYEIMKDTLGSPIWLKIETKGLAQLSVTTDTLSISQAFVDGPNRVFDRRK